MVICAAITVAFGAAEAAAFEPLFDARLDFNLGRSASFVTGADLNGDSFEDLVVVLYDEDSLLVMFNNFNGTFGPPTAYPASRGARSAVAVDIDNDSDLDLAVAAILGNVVPVLMNSGFGHFDTTIMHTVPGSNPASIRAGDFNEDGWQDLALAMANSNAALVMLNAQNGTFTNRLITGIGSYPTSIVVTDFNNDTHRDFGVACYESGGLTVKMGNGDGIFDSTYAYALGFGSGPRMVTSGDLNGDGFSDLVSANYDSNNISVLLNNSDGRFGAAVNYQSGQQCRAVAISDLNGDMMPDIVAANYSGSVSVLINSGNGLFGPGVNYISPAYPRNALPFDMNNYGIIDIAISHQDAFALSLYRGRGDGTLIDGHVVPFIPDWASMAAADFDVDGCEDLVAIDDENIFICRGACNGDIEPPGEMDAINYGSQIMPMDMNRDGYPDLVINHFNYARIFSVYLNDRSGNLALDSFYYYSNPDYIYDITLGDFNGDRAPDVVSPLIEDSLLFWFNDGEGNFGAPVVIAAGESNLRLMAAADFNGDGREDLAASSSGFTELVLFASVSDSIFTPMDTLQLPNGIGQVKAADITGDSAPDLVVNSGNYYYMFANQGNWIFTGPDSMVGEIGSSAYIQAIEDLDLDGDLDLLINSGSFQHRFRVAVNEQGEFDYEPHFYGPPYNSIPKLLADLDNDGDLDMYCD
jgi:hypothetical protein